MIIQPYSDEYMIFDEKTCRYILTEKALLDRLGISLSSAVKDNPNGTNAVLDRVSMHCYRKIHEHGSDVRRRDAMIATSDGGREIIFEAMLEQFFYMKTVGDLSMSTDRERRKLWFSDNAYEILLRPVPEFGVSVCYVGGV